MIGKKKNAKAELNEKTDIKTPVSEMVHYQIGRAHV